MTPSVCSGLLDDVVHDVTMIREAAAPALSAGVGQNQDLTAAILQQLIDMYEVKLKVSVDGRASSLGPNSTRLSQMMCKSAKYVNQ